MPIYKTSSRLLTKDGRKGALQTVGMIADHMDGLGVDVVAITYAAGDLSIELNRAIPVNQAEHLGLIRVS